MNALTISQPYASLIADGKKFVENRTWPAPQWAIGKDIAIHAGKGTQYLTREQLNQYPHGCVIAVATLEWSFPVSLVRKMAADDPTLKGNDDGTTWGAIANNEHTEGPWCWGLSNVRTLEHPVPATGKQGLWKWDILSEIVTSPAESAAAGPNTPSTC